MERCSTRPISIYARSADVGDKKMKYDVVIVGAGVSGLYCALHLPKNLKVLLVCKEEAQECNTYYAQGGICVALDAGDVESHINDSLNAGAYLNDLEALKILSEESLKVVDDLESFGIAVDRDEKGKILYTQEGGHQRARIVHFDGDGSGKFLHTQLLKRLPHELWKNTQVLDLIFEDQKCLGVIVRKNEDIFEVWADCVVLASGGVGGLYTYHTNARTLSADLHGIILKHGLKLKDMEMMQFHPTAYVEAPSARKPLISEAVRGEGGKIVDSLGRRFLFSYDERGELAPRDIVARGIFEYCRKENEKAFLDLSSFKQGEFEKRFPNIFSVFEQYKLRLPKIPVFPAFHYCMGGIEVDKESRVVGVENLYAIGECANNGIHGANRLASNSLLEGLVFGKRAANEICHSLMPCNKRIKPNIPSNLFMPRDLALKQELRTLMWDYVGIIRSKNGLQKALERVMEMLESRDMGEMFALRLRVAREIILHALAREKSLGAHFLTDDA